MTTGARPPRVGIAEQRDLQEGPVRACLDDLVTALYVLIEDPVGPKPRRTPAALSCRTPNCCAWPPPKPCSASTMKTTGCGSATGPATYSPICQASPTTNKRLGAVGQLLAVVLRYLGVASPSWCDELHPLDATPLPCGASRKTVRRSALWGHANSGCASHSRWY
jgi:hypothetical protein